MQNPKNFAPSPPFFTPKNATSQQISSPFYKKKPLHPAFFTRYFTKVTPLLLLFPLLFCVSCATTRSFTPISDIPSLWPTPKSHTITSEIGKRANGHYHAGIDIAAPKKSPVIATAAGTVTYAARNDGGYGKLVIIDHGNNLETRYAHLYRIKTKRGKHVKRGQVIGKVGKTGNATGFHLHYEIRIKGQPVDPHPYLPR